MWKADQWKDYEVLDTSDGEKLERWGSFYLVRPDPQVIWSTPRQTRAGSALTRAMPARALAAGTGPRTICRSTGASATAS